MMEHILCTMRERHLNSVEIISEVLAYPVSVDILSKSQICTERIGNPDDLRPTINICLFVKPSLQRYVKLRRVCCPLSEGELFTSINITWQPDSSLVPLLFDRLPPDAMIDIDGSEHQG